MIAFENQKLQVLPEEENKLRLQPALVSLEEELERVFREINSAIIDAGDNLQLQALSQEELKLQTLLKILQKEQDAESAVNDRTVNHRTLIIATAKPLRI